MRPVIGRIHSFYKFRPTLHLPLRQSSCSDLAQSHIDLNFPQKLLLAVGSGIGVQLDPRRADLLSSFGEVTGDRALRTMFDKMSKHPVGRNILAERPRIRTNTLDMDYLSQLPIHTFGHAYYAFLTHYNYSPDDRHVVRFIDNPDLAYVMQRYREGHDLIHVLLDQPTDMLGEVVVKWVEGLQTGLPMCLLGGYFGSLRLAPVESLMCVYFEKHWEDPIDQLRASLNIPPPPVRVKRPVTD